MTVSDPAPPAPLASPPVPPDLVPLAPPVPLIPPPPSHQTPSHHSAQTLPHSHKTKYSDHHPSPALLPPQLSPPLHHPPLAAGTTSGTVETTSSHGGRVATRSPGLAHRATVDPRV